MPKSIPDGLTKQNVLDSLKDLDGGIEHSFGEATGYHLVHEGREYAPKAVVGIAFRHLTGEILSHTEFSGGENKGQANYVLRELGFAVESIRQIFITSRGFALPEKWEEFEQRFWFNMWQKRMFAFREVNEGDTLYWYDSQKQRIVWKSKVAEIDRFEYASKEEARKRLIESFGEDPETDPYFKDKSESGFCIAFKIVPLEKLDLPKPEEFNFPQGGWLRGSDQVAIDWLTYESDVERQIEKLVIEVDGQGYFIPDNESDDRERILRSIVQRRGQPQFRSELLQAYERRCAITGCDVVAALEAAHISPYSGDQSNHITNGLLLRADIHTMFDLQLIGIEPVSLRIRIADSLFGTCYEELDGGKLTVADNPNLHPSFAALEIQWKLFHRVEWGIATGIGIAEGIQNVKN